VAFSFGGVILKREYGNNNNNDEWSKAGYLYYKNLKRRKLKEDFHKKEKERIDYEKKYWKQSGYGRSSRNSGGDDAGWLQQQ